MKNLILKGRTPYLCAHSSDELQVTRELKMVTGAVCMRHDRLLPLASVKIKSTMSGIKYLFKYVVNNL
jgi:hypothetical protein